MNTTVKLEEKLEWLAIRNLAKGGILLASSIKNKSTSPDEDKDVNFRILKISNENVSKPLVMKSPVAKCIKNETTKFEQALRVRIIEDYKNEICFDFSCMGSPQNLEFSRKCILKEELLKFL